jgi:hypothetical protein
MISVVMALKTALSTRLGTLLKVRLVLALGLIFASIAAVSLALLVTSGTPALDGYVYRKQIMVDHTLVSGTAELMGFPVLIHVQHADLRHVAFGGKVLDPAGSDLAFGKSDGETRLLHDLESYDPESGTVTAWVRTDTLSPVEDLSVYLYYHHPAPTASDPDGVWDADYLGVWHLNENETDYSAQNHHLSPTNATDAQGKMAGGKHMAGNGFLSAGNLTEINGATRLTGSIWAKADALHGDGALMAKDTWGGHSSLLFWRDESGAMTARPMTFSVLTNGTSRDERIEGSPNLSKDTDWHYVVFTFEGGSASGLRLFVDGEEDSYSPGNTASIASIKTTAHPFLIGSAIGSGGFRGILDEARLSASVKSPDWIRTEYRNQSDPAAYLTLGPEEVADGSSLPVEFGDVTAQYETQRRTVMIRWSTFNERNNEGFEVEKSADGNLFEQIGFIAGAGSSGKTLNYELEDPWIGTQAVRLFYRIKQIDFDGSVNYSPVVEALVPAHSSDLTITAAFQPMEKRIQVTVTSSSGTGLTFRLLSLSGRVVAEKPAPVPAGHTDTHWDLPKSISPGVYLFQAINGKTLVCSQKVLVRQD